MSKFVVLGVVFITILSGQCKLYSNDDSTLCASQKTNSKCSCQLKGKENRSFPVLTADCTRLGLKELPVHAKLPGIDALDMSFNSFRKLDYSEYQSYELQSLNLSFNKIIDVFQNFFKYIPNLRELDLSRNEIVYLSNSNVFGGLSNLTILNLSFNRISTMPEDIFKPLINLNELDLRYNFFGAILMNSEDFFNTTLGCSKSIVTLKLDGLGITNLAYGYFSEAHNLKYLSLADNPLTIIPPAPYSVEFLDLSGTHLTRIAGKYLNYHSLKTLKLKRLRILEDIEDYAFYNLPSLEELHLSDSRALQTLPDLAFGAITDGAQLPLKKIFLSRTGLNTINSTYLSIFRKLELVDFQYNPLDCNCDILWLQQLNGSLPYDENIRCLTPRNLRSKKVMGLTYKEMPDCFSAENTVQRILIALLGILVGLLTLLILYLLYLGPFHQRHRSIGPGSPYQSVTVTIDPNKAENVLR